MKLFITAKTTDVCVSIAEALSDLFEESVLFCSENGAKPDFSGVDFVVVSTPLSNEFGLEFVADASKLTDAPIVVLAREDIAEDVQRRIKFTGAFVLPKPFKKSVLEQTVRMAMIAKENMNRIDREKSELSKQLEDMRVVDRAKCVLIQYLNLTEPQAHRHIQKLAMDTRKTQREIAEDILKTYLE